MGKMCGTHGQINKDAYLYWWEELREKTLYRSGDGIILKWILEKQDVKVWI
jgi:hypothetical protein